MGIEKKILTLNGDGIGPEIMQEGVKVLKAVAEKYGHKFNFVNAPFGAGAYFEFGNCFPDQSRSLVKDPEIDGILKGPVGLDNIGRSRLAEKGVDVEDETIGDLRMMLDSYACYRPVMLPKQLAEFSPLRSEIVGEGIDILMMRELTGGIYFGQKIEGSDTNQRYASDECKYTREQIERFAHVCFGEADAKGTKLTNVHKNNVKATARFWKNIFEEVATKYPSVKLEDSLVDSFATKMCINPAFYNGVVALENMEGDIITDLAGGIIGSLGLMPSACWNPERNEGYFEPSHGSAPDIAGKNIANPYSMIGSAAYMLDIAFGLERESKDVWDVMMKIYSDGFRTSDLAKPETKRSKILSTSQFGDLVVKNILG